MAVPYLRRVLRLPEPGRTSLAPPRWLMRRPERGEGVPGGAWSPSVPEPGPRSVRQVAIGDAAGRAAAVDRADPAGGPARPSRQEGRAGGVEPAGAPAGGRLAEPPRGHHEPGPRVDRGQGHRAAPPGPAATEADAGPRWTVAPAGDAPAASVTVPPAHAPAASASDRATAGPDRHPAPPDPMGQGHPTPVPVAPVTAPRPAPAPGAGRPRPELRIGTVEVIVEPPPPPPPVAPPAAAPRPAAAASGGTRLSRGFPSGFELRQA